MGERGIWKRERERERGGGGGKNYLSDGFQQAAVIMFDYINVLYLLLYCVCGGLSTR